jgi:ribosomal protein S12 methylthiotransferase
MGAEPRFCSYLDMPLQHSHGAMLKAMRRGGDAGRYLRLLERARELVPDVFLRSTFIVGFPGETEEHFRDLLGFVERARFDHLGAFAFSPEPGTPAANLAGTVPRGVARRRLRQLLTAQRPVALAARRRLIGRRLAVLVEGPSAESEHLLAARHHGMAPEIDGQVLINDVEDGALAAAAGPLGAGGAGDLGGPGGRWPVLGTAEITEAHASDLVGRLVEPLAAGRGAVAAAPASGPLAHRAPAVSAPPVSTADRRAARAVRRA